MLNLTNDSINLKFINSGCLQLNDTEIMIFGGRQMHEDILHLKVNKKSDQVFTFNTKTLTVKKMQMRLPVEVEFPQNN